MKTKLPIHPEWLSLTITRFYHYVMLGYKITVYADGSYYGEELNKT